MVISEESSPDVLIAEDDPLLRQNLRTLLEGQGYTCAEAENGRDAVDLARRRPPRCILLDLAMPEMDGFTAARILRADPTTRDVHIHCLTGLADPEARRQAKEAGCERFLAKPVDLDLLLEAVRDEAVELRMSLAQAEDFLDWLQNQGMPTPELVFDAQGVTVRLVCPPGRKLIQDADGTVRMIDSSKPMPPSTT